MMCPLKAKGPGTGLHCSVKWTLSMIQSWIGRELGKGDGLLQLALWGREGRKKGCPSAAGGREGKHPLDTITWRDNLDKKSVSWEIHWLPICLRDITWGFESMERPMRFLYAQWISASQPWAYQACKVGTLLAGLCLLVKKKRKFPTSPQLCFPFLMLSCLILFELVMNVCSFFWFSHFAAPSVPVLDYQGQNFRSILKCLNLF